MPVHFIPRLSRLGRRHFGIENQFLLELIFVYRDFLKVPIKRRRRFLALLLLVLRVLADNHNLALTANDLALLADRLYRRAYLHVILPPSNFWWDGTPETCPATTGAQVTCVPPPAFYLTWNAK